MVALSFFLLGVLLGLGVNAAFGYLCRLLQSAVERTLQGEYSEPQVSQLARAQLQALRDRRYGGAGPR